MLSSRCPSCGRPARVSLAEPTLLRCEACGYHGAGPADAVARLTAAGQLLAALDARARQLTAAQLRAVRWARTIAVVYLVVLTVLALPYAGCGAAAVVGLRDAGTSDGAALAWTLSLFFGPALLFFGVGFFGQRSLRARLRRLEEAAAAVPPARPGEPCACRVCGATLAAAGANAIARCAFCAADNIVSPAVVARAAGERAVDLERLSDSVKERASATGSVGVAAVALLPVIALAAPVVAGLFWVAALSAAVNLEGEVDTSIPFVLIETEKGSLFVRGTSSSDVKMPKGLARTTGAEVRKVANAKWLAGKRVRPLESFGEPTGASTVRVVYGSPVLPDEVYVRLENGSRIAISRGIFVLE